MAFGGEKGRGGGEVCGVVFPVSDIYTPNHIRSWVEKCPGCRREWGGGGLCVCVVLVLR